MNSGITLIDNAVEVCGSRYKLAQLLGVSQAALSNIVREKGKMSPALAARMARIAGKDPVRETLLAVVESCKDGPEREEMEQLLFSKTDDALGLLSITRRARGVTWWSRGRGFIRPHR